MGCGPRSTSTRARSRKVQAHRLLEALVQSRADAPDVDVVGDAGFAHLEVGDIGLQVIEPQDAGIHQLLAEQCLHRQGNVAEGFLDFLCSYDNFFKFELISWRTGVLCQAAWRSRSQHQSQPHDAPYRDAHVTPG
jgi:hypothetical protein